MLPKLNIVWKGETIIVSKLVSDHHRKNREKRTARDSAMHNVSGLDFESPETGHGAYDDSSANGSFSNTEGNDLYSPMPAVRKKVERNHSDRTTEDESLEGSSAFMLAAKEVMLANDLANEDPENPAEKPMNDNTEDIPDKKSKQVRIVSPTTKDAATVSSSIMDVIAALPFESEPAKNSSRTHKLLLKQKPDGSRIQRRKGKLRSMSIHQGQQRLVLTPDETPPRRIVLKMVDLQEQLTDMNTKIMTGLSVKEHEWDNVCHIIGKLEKMFREDVKFSWRTEDDAEDDVVLEATKRGVGEQPSGEPARSGGETGGSASGLIRQRTKKSLSISRVAHEFKKVVDVRDRKSGMMSYPDVFIGSDAVDALIYAGLAEDRKSAVKLGRRLASELRLFKHVTGDYDFEDSMLFYDYMDKDDDSMDSFQDTEAHESMHLSDLLEGGMEKEAKAFKDAVAVSDQKYRMKLYAKCFTGSGNLC
jgi:hypothetical protein